MLVMSWGPSTATRAASSTLPITWACTELSAFLLHTIWAQTVKHSKVHANFPKFQMRGEQLSPLIRLAETPWEQHNAVKEVPWQSVVPCCCPVLVKSQVFLFFSNFSLRCHSLLHKEDQTVIFLTILVKKKCMVHCGES